ncbi:hypothetical protein KOW79_001902 [Hemibagrus wyckioides]|uniref:Uncharacterized protein n=1 Tax=Hemibagrus wyckioides TaxID=337641 RepID=A0A9D3P653_9TELE|nr:hypothetical protein KOW79_001902 [Hemibagrus wyckioides]
MGIKGRSGLDIDCLGFLFINTIKSAKLTNIEYPTIHKVTPKVAVGEIKSMSYQNNTSVTQEYKIETSKKITQTSSWSVTSKLEFTVSLEVKAGIPLLAESTSKYEFKIGVEGTYASETSEEKMELFSFPVKVPPRKTVDVHIALEQQGDEIHVGFSLKVKSNIMSYLANVVEVDGSRLGAIKFKTSHSREFYARLRCWRLKPEVSVDVASGICMGIKGRSGWDIDRFGFIFINTVKSAELTNVMYPNIHDVIPKVAVGEIKSMSYQNNTSETQQYTIETSKKITQTSSWSVTGKLELTYSLKVNAGIPLLVEGSSRYELNIGVEATYASETSEEKMELFSFPVKVPPGKTVDVHIALGQATVDLPFTGIVKITCYNGSVLELKTSGTYKGVAFSDGKVVVNESNKKLCAA